MTAEKKNEREFQLNEKKYSRRKSTADNKVCCYRQIYSIILYDDDKRKNEIKDINEILHLSQLQFLKKLSLEDNPCANVDNYRLTVLKALPNLEYLDNVK